MPDIWELKPDWEMKLDEKVNINEIVLGGSLEY